AQSSVRTSSGAWTSASARKGRRSSPRSGIRSSEGPRHGPSPVMRRSLRRVTKNAVVVIGGVSALVIVIVAVFAGRLAPHPPDEQNFDPIEARPGMHALLGTDRFGRDVLSRVIHGARVSLYVAVTSIGLA